MVPRLRLKTLAALIALGVVSLIGGCAMAGPLILASALTGTLVDSTGSPQAGVPVTRSWTWAWTGETGTDTATTDAAGTFTFPEVTGRSLTAGFLPHEVSIFTTVEAEGPDGPVRLLSVDKQSYDRDEELRGTKLSGPGITLVCRIDAEPGDDGPFWGTCRAP